MSSLHLWHWLRNSLSIRLAPALDAGRWTLDTPRGVEPGPGAEDACEKWGEEEEHRPNASLESRVEGRESSASSRSGVGRRASRAKPVRVVLVSSHVRGRLESAACPFFQRWKLNARRSTHRLGRRASRVDSRGIVMLTVHLADNNFSRLFDHLTHLSSVLLR